MPPIDGLLLLVLALILVVLLFAWLSKRSKLLPDLKNKAVLVTGCDSGFGHELAKRLDKLGVTVFAGCLFPEGAGAVGLKSACSNQLHVIHLDVTKDDHIKNAVKTVKNSLGAKVLWAVVNNAGIGIVGNMEWMDVQTVKRAFDVNTFGPVAVTNAFLPLLRKSRGRVVIVSSIAGRQACPVFGVYCMSKHATTALANILRCELSQWGITVHDIQPGFFRTNILQLGYLEKDLESSWNKLHEEVRSAYGQKYFDNYKAMMRNCTVGAGIVSSKTYLVVNDLLDSVLGNAPKSVYHPGLRTKVMYVLLLLMPLSVMNYLLAKFLPELQTNEIKTKHTEENIEITRNKKE